MRRGGAARPSEGHTKALAGRDAEGRGRETRETGEA